MATRILLVDDHQIMRDGITLLLRAEPDFEIIGHAFDSDAAWLAVQEKQPDLVVMDLDIPGEGGIAITARIRSTYPDIKVIVLTGHAEPQYVNSALRAGANGYMLKFDAGEMLLSAIRIALSGQVYLSPEISTVVVKEYKRTGEKSVEKNLPSAREIEILKRVADGQSTKEIAFALSLSIKTVETHRLNLMAKIGVNSVAELTKYAVREGITTL